MGKKLVRLYDYMEELLGLPGKLALAKATTMPSIVAASLPDSDENVDRMREAIKRITGRDAPYV